jgi:hypothetical protein
MYHSSHSQTSICFTALNNTIQLTVKFEQVAAYGAGSYGTYTYFISVVDLLANRRLANTTLSMCVKIIAHVEYQ